MKLFQQSKKISNDQELIQSDPILLKIFDNKILHILTYGAEIRFSHPALDVEKIHRNFCIYILQVSMNSLNISARGELGRGNIYTVRCIKLVKYWLRILDMNAN